LKATVVKLTRDRVCEARTDNEILFVFSLPNAVDVGVAPAPEPQVHRPRGVDRLAQRRPQRGRVAGADDGHAGDRAEDAEVLGRVV